MDYKELNDYELLYTVRESDDGFNVLYDKYKPLLNKYANKWLSIARVYGYEFSDVYQIVSLVFLDATNKYDVSKNAKFITYLIKSLDNNLKMYLKKYSRVKDYVVLSYDDYENADGLDSDSGYLNYIASDFDLEKEIIGREVEHYINRFMYALPINKAVIFELYITGYGIAEISELLDIDYKVLCNMLYRIKQKFIKMFDEDKYF